MGRLSLVAGKEVLESLKASADEFRILPDKDADGSYIALERRQKGSDRWTWLGSVEDVEYRFGGQIWCLGDRLL